MTLTGDFILLPEAPQQLAVSPSVGEAEDDDSGDDDSGADEGDAEAFGDAEDAGDAPEGDSAPADAGATAVAAAEIEADTSEVNPVQSGDGGETFLGAAGGPSQTELAALQNGDQVAVIANAPEIFATFLSQSEVESDPALAQLGTLRGPVLGLGAPSDDGDAVAAIDNLQLFLQAPPPNFPTQTRAERFAEGFARYDDGAASVSQRTDNPGGITDALIGVFDASMDTPIPVQIDLGTLADVPPEELPQAFFTVNLFEPLPFGRGPELANLTASAAFFQTAAFAGTSNFGTVQQVDSELEFDVNLGSGSITDGILDVFIQNTAGDQATFVTDFTGTITNGVIQPMITRIEILDTANINDPMAVGNPATGTLVGSFIGTGDTPGALLGWHYEESGMLIGGATPVVTDGVVVLTDQGGMPQPQLEDLNTSGFLAIAVPCCFIPTDPMPETPEIIAVRAQNAAASIDGNVQLGFNEDTFGDPLDPSDPNFLTTPVAVTVTNNETIANFSRDLSVGGMTLDTVALVEFNGFLGNPIDLTSTVPGQPSDTFNGLIQFATFFPALRSSLPTGATIYSSKGMGNLAAAGFYNLAPTTPVSLNFLSVSFIADSTSGTITAGNLATDSLDTMNGGLFNTFFESTDYIDIADGTVAVSLFDDLNPPDGSYRQRNALDIDSVAGGSFDQSGVFVGGYNLVSQDGTDTFQSIGNFVIPAQTDARLTQLELSSIDRNGVVVFNPLDGDGILRSDLPVGVHPGMIVGYANGGMDPLIMGNATGFDEVDVWALPADTVVRIGGANLFNFTADVQATDLGNSLPGFQVDWGTWNSTPMAAVSGQTDQNDAAVNSPIDVDVFFATIEDTTPVANLAAMTGTVSYGGTFSSLTSGSTAAALGRGGSLATPTFTSPIDSLSASFDVSMDTGLVTNGLLQVQYLNADTLVGQVTFDATYTGALNGAVLDLQVDTLTVTHGGTSMIPAPGDIGNSNIAGALLGNSAEQAINAFQLSGQGEHTEGFFLINQM